MARAPLPLSCRLSSLQVRNNLPAFLQFMQDRLCLLHRFPPLLEDGHILESVISMKRIHLTLIKVAQALATLTSDQKGFSYTRQTRGLFESFLRRFKLIPAQHTNPPRTLKKARDHHSSFMLFIKLDIVLPASFSTRMMNGKLLVLLSGRQALPGYSKNLCMQGQRSPTRQTFYSSSPVTQPMCYTASPFLREDSSPLKCSLPVTNPQPLLRATQREGSLPHFAGTPPQQEDASLMGKKKKMSQSPHLHPGKAGCVAVGGFSTTI